MFASQAALNITSHNIANVNTPGFTRRGVVLETANPAAIYGGFLGSGVKVSTVKRHYDTFIQSQLLGQRQNYGRSFALNQALSHIEQVFNDVKDMGLSRSLTGYLNSWQEIAAYPEGQPQRIVMLQKANALVQSAKHMEMNITETLKNIEESITDITDRINVISSEIARLNEDIVQIEAGQQHEKAGDLRDQRDLLLKELSEFINISYFEDKSGYLTIHAGTRNLVHGVNANKLTIKIEEGRSNIFLGDTNITPYINRGQLGGLLDVRNDIESVALKSLRKLIASLIKETNLIHRAGYGLDASTGNNFFNPIHVSTSDYSSGADITSAAVSDLSQLTLDEYDISFNSGTYNVRNRQTGAVAASGAYESGSPITFDGISIVITGNVSDNDRFFISPLTEAIKNFGVEVSDTMKIAASLSNLALPADNGNALRMAGMSAGNITELGSSFELFYRGIVSRVGTMSRASSDSLRFDENLLNELNNRRESLSGVSLDEEAANLIRFQRSFEAGARMIKVTDELLQTILNL
jgi:flagellar hook-associated protein 1 FlgK